MSRKIKERRRIHAQPQNSQGCDQSNPEYREADRIRLRLSLVGFLHVHHDHQAEIIEDRHQAIEHADYGETDVSLLDGRAEKVKLTHEPPGERKSG